MSKVFSPPAADESISNHSLPKTTNAEKMVPHYADCMATCLSYNRSHGYVVPLPSDSLDDDGGGDNNNKQTFTKWANEEEPMLLT